MIKKILVFIIFLSCFSFAEVQNSKNYHIGFALGLTGGSGFSLKKDYTEKHSVYYTFFPYYNSEYSDLLEYSDLFLSLGFMYQYKMHETNFTDFLVGAGANHIYFSGDHLQTFAPATGVLFKFTKNISATLMISNPVLFDFSNNNTYLLPMADISIFYKITKK